MEDQKQFIIEYILTNGQLPGFEKRLQKSKRDWTISTEPFIVYRGQGHSKPGIQKPEEIVTNTIQNAVRSVISTSYNINNVIEFTDKSSCCIFEITVQPGIRFLDFTKKIIKENDIGIFMNTIKVIEDSENKIWPNNSLKIPKLFEIFENRKEKEKEILLDGFQGTFKSLGEDIYEEFTIPIEKKSSKKKTSKKGDNTETEKIRMRIIKKSYELKSGGRRIRTRKISKKHFKRRTRK